MIGVSMREENELHIQLVTVCKAHHFLRIGAGVKSCRSAAVWVPDEVSVNGNAAIICVELRDAVERFDFLWLPIAYGEFAKSVPVQAKDGRNPQESRFVDTALAQLADCFRTDTRFFGQFGIGNAQA